MRVAILHNAVAEDGAPDERDVQVQAGAVAEALADLGHEVITLSCDLNLAALKSDLEGLAPDRVFNLVESLDGRGALIHVVPFALEAWGVPFTGCGAEAMMRSSNKIMAKTALRAAGLPTPDWRGPYPTVSGSLRGHAAGTAAARGAAAAISTANPKANPTSISAVNPTAAAAGDGRWLIKSVWEHASIGLEQDALLANPTEAALAEALAARAPALGGSCFAEPYIEGREFNLALLAGPGGPRVLPPAEIRFDDFAPDQLRIVGYKAKWDESAFEYHHTPRRFDYPPEDGPLLAELIRLARAAWDLFDMAGHARVDFRVTPEGMPFILEVNANPCLSPDAGFAAALAEAGIPFTEAVRAILVVSN